MASLFDKLTNKYNFTVESDTQPTFKASKTNLLFDKMTNKYDYTVPKNDYSSLNTSPQSETDEEFFNRLRKQNFKTSYNDSPKQITTQPKETPKNDKGEPIDLQFQVDKLKQLRTDGKALYKNKSDKDIIDEAGRIVTSDKKKYDVGERVKINSGDTSYNAFLNNNNIKNNIGSKIAYGLETPYRIKGISNIFSTIAENMGVGKSPDDVTNIYKDQRLTGNKITDTITGFAGQAGSMLTAIPGTSTNPINVGDNFATAISNKATNSVGKIGASAIRGAVGGAIDNTVDNMKNVNSEQDLAESALGGALTGGLLFGGGKAIKEGTSKLLGNGSKTITNTLEDGIQAPIKTKSDIQSKGINKSIKPVEVNTPIEPINTPNKIQYSNPLVRIKKDRIEGVDSWSSKPLAERNINNIGSKNVKPIQMDYPELKPFIQREAQGTLKALDNSIPGERTAFYDNEIGETIVNGVKRQVDPIISDIQQAFTNKNGKTNITYDEIRQGLNDIVEDHGKENYAKAKKIESILDDSLSNGSVDYLGNELPPNTDYLESKSILSELEKGKGFPKYNNQVVFSGNVPLNEKFKPTKPIKDTVSPMNIGEELPGIRQPLVNANIDNPSNFDLQFAESKQKTNTWKNADMMQSKDIQKMVKEIDAFYEVKPNKKSFDIATAEINNNMDNVINRIKNEGINTAEDSVASGVITNRLLSEAKSTGDYSKVREWLGVVRPQITDIAQSLQAFSTWKNMSPEGTLLKAQRVVDSAKDNLLKNKRLRKALEDEIAKNPSLESEILDKYKVPKLTEEDTKFIIDTMEKIQGMEDGRAKEIEFAKIKQLMAEKTVPTFADKFKAAQRISMLLNTKTMTRNVVGNIVMGGLENIKDVPGTLIDKGVEKLTGNRTTSIPSLKTQLQGFKDGFKNTLEDHKLGIDTARSQGQYELPNSKSFRSGPLSKLEDLTSTGLKLGDNPFYEAAYQDTIRQLQKFNGNKEITNEMIDYAKKIAEDRTFQNNSTISNALKTVQRGLNGGKDIGLGTVALPFVKTPANILDKAIDYSPAGLIKGGGKLFKNRGLEISRSEQKKIVDQLSRGLTGTGLMGLGYLGAESGVLTGSGPDNKEALMLEKQAGKLPYSIKTGDTYNTIDNLQPAAIPLMVGADMQKSIKNSKNGLGAIEDGLKTGFSTLANQSLLTGLSKLFGGYNTSPGENIIEGVQNTLIQTPQQFFPSAIKQGAQIIDPKTRDTSSSSKIGTEINKMISKTPFLSKTLPSGVDTLGREKTNFGGSEGAKYLYDVLFNPGITGKYNPSKSEDLALGIYNETGDTTQMPRVAKGTITYKGTDGKNQSIQLTNSEKNELQKYIGDKTNTAYSSFNQSGSKTEQAKKLQKILSDIYSEGENIILRKRGLPTKK